MVHTQGNGSSEAPKTPEAQAEPEAVAGPKTSPPAKINYIIKDCDAVGS